MMHEERSLAMKRCYKICVLLLLVDLSLGKSNASPNITVLATVRDSFLLTTHQEEIQLDPWITPENGMICVAFFTKMCENCELHLSLGNSLNKTVHLESYQNTEWTEMKFLAKDLPPVNYTFTVNTISNDPNRFWALDDVRRCTENDVRFTQIESRGDYFPSYSCYSLGASTVKIDLKNLKDIQTSNSTCPEDTFGSSCMPCNNILSSRFCENHAVCEVAEGETTKCTCSAGFRGHRCEQGCRDKFYGFGCKQSCGQCSRDHCNHINGGCSPCREGYTGDTCKMPSYSVRNLTLYSKTETSASLRWRPPYPPTNILKNYQVIYKCTTYWCTENLQIIEGDWCKIWPKFLCATIIIKRYGNYTFQFDVYARNETSKKYGLPQFVRGKLTVEKPEPPNNVTADWDDHHNLTLSWIHPDVTNGPLTGFVITINNGPQKTLKYEEQLRYNYTVTNQPPSSKVTVTVAARTKAGESSAIQIETYSPPKTPGFSADPYVQEAGNSNLSLVIPTLTDFADDSIFYIIVTELPAGRPSTSLKTPKHVEELSDIESSQFSWIAREILSRDYARNVLIGSNTARYSHKLELILQDRALKVGTNYIITLMLSNTYMNTTRWRVKEIRCMTAGVYQADSGNKDLGLLGLLVLPLLCVVGFILIRKYKVRIRTH